MPIEMFSFAARDISFITMICGNNLSVSKLTASSLEAPRSSKTSIHSSAVEVRLGGSLASLDLSRLPRLSECKLDTEQLLSSPFFHVQC